MGRVARRGGILVFLPPLLFAAAFTTSWRDVKENVQPILLLAIGLVLMTAAAVAVVAHALIAHLTWPAAFVLGAVVAPTDPVATEAIAERLGLPRRIVVILQGESLVNDATALVIYRIALGVALGDAFSLGGAAGKFLLVSAGGIAVGLAVGWLVGRLAIHLPDDAPVENTVPLLTPLAAHLPAEWLHVSGVLSVVACGIYLGRRDPRAVSAQTRLQRVALWRMVTFLLNGLLFLLVGLQLRHLEQELPPETSLGALMLATLLISLTVVAVRIAWVFPAAFLSHRLISSAHRDDPFPSWRHITIVAWSGMRGGISLAVAIAIPLTLGGDASLAPFPARDAILFVTLGVILVTLVAQGLSLPPLIRALGIVAGPEEQEEELRARYHTAHAVIERLDTLSGASEAHGIPSPIHEEVRRAYLVRHQRLNARLTGDKSGVRETDACEPGENEDDPAAPDEADVRAYLHLKREVLDAERTTAIRLRDSGEISDWTLRRLQRDLDLDETRLRALNGRPL